MKKKIKIPMSKEQYKKIKNFLTKNKIYLDGNTIFGLIAQPLMGAKKIDIVLLTPTQCDGVEELFKKIKLVNP